MFKPIDYIITNARPSNGYLGESMYNHGFATLALAEAYGTVDNDKIGPALQKAVDLLLTSQENNPRGGWRYSPESTSADTTVSGAQLMALLAARNAGIEVPDKAIERALQYMKSCQDSSGGIGYTSASGGRAVLTAVATTCYGIAHKKDTAEFKSDGPCGTTRTSANSNSANCPTATGPAATDRCSPPAPPCSRSP